MQSAGEGAETTTPTSGSYLPITSPPYLRVSAPESINESNAGGAGRSKSPPEMPATFAGAAGGSSAASSTSKPKRKRSMIACKNCNERRVRCDGATNGLPCSNCKHVGKADCQFIESKRVRGARGRFESRDGASTSPTVAAKRPLALSVATPHRSNTTRRHSISGTDGDEWRKLLQNSASVHRSTTGPVTYLGESWHLSWVVQEQLPTDEKPLHMPTLMMEDDGDVHNRVNKELWEKGAYVLPRYEVRDLLIAQYFEVAHPNYPILCKSAFLHSLQTNTFSHQLVQGVLMVAAVHCDWAILQRAGYVSRREAIEGFYRRCRLLWDGDVEPDKITNIQTMFLMQFWWRAVTDHKEPLWWLSGAIRMAQSMGLHRSAGRSRLNQRDKRIWRRTWWLLFLRDRQASSHFGKPMMIYDKDCDVEELEYEDLESEVDRVQALAVLEHVKLAKLITTITTCEFCPGTTRDLSERIQLRDACHHQLSMWQQGLPPELVYQSNHKNLSAMSLQISFLSQLLLLNRPVIFTDTSLPDRIRKPAEIIASNAADAITKISDDLIKMWGARYMTQHSMSCLFAAMTVQMIKRRAPDPNVADDADCKLRQNMDNLISLDKILPMAGWIHRRYSRILDREGESDDARTASISPPAMVDVIGVPPMLPSQRPPQRQQMLMEIIKEDEDAEALGSELVPPPAGTGNEDVDEWSRNVQLLHLEHSLTAPGAAAVLMPGVGMEGEETMGVGLQERLDAMQPEIFDYHWFMENIGAVGDPFLWNQQQVRS